MVSAVCTYSDARHPIGRVRAQTEYIKRAIVAFAGEQQYHRHRH